MGDEQRSEASRGEGYDPISMSKLYGNTDAFYDGEEARRKSQEHDLGVNWSEDDGPGSMRVSWVEDTGEIYLRLGSGKIEVLGSLASWAEVEALRDVAPSLAKLRKLL